MDSDNLTTANLQQIMEEETVIEALEKSCLQKIN